MVGRVVLVRGRRLGGALCGGAWLAALRWRAVVVHGPPHAGACCGGAWPPSWWGALCWCLAPLMVGHAVVVPDPLVVGRVALVRGPPYGGACCDGAWPSSWWSVAPGMVERAVLVRVSVFLFGGSVSVAVVWVLGPHGRPSLPNACGDPPLCPGRDGRAGLPSGCDAPPPVVVSPPLSPCRSFSLVRPALPCACAAAVRRVAVVPSSFAPPPPSSGCALQVSSSRCCSSPSSQHLLVAAVGFPWAFAAAGRSPPLPHPATCWSGCRWCRRPAARFCLLALCFVLAACLFTVAGGSGFLLHPQPPRGLCCAGLLPCCLFFLVFSVLACCPAPFGLSPVPAACCCSSASPSPRLVFAGVARLPFVVSCVGFAFVLLPARLPFGSFFCAPPSSPLISVSRASALVLLGALRLWLPSAAFPAAVCFAACWAVLCCAAVCCAATWDGLVRCAVLFALCLAVCLGLCFCGLCRVSWCCAALRCMMLLCALPCCCALCCLRCAVLLFLALFGAALSCAMAMAALCLAGAVLCCTVLLCVVLCLAVW